MFSSGYATTEEFKNRSNNRSCWICAFSLGLRKTWSRKSRLSSRHQYRKAPILKCFTSTRKRKAGFSNCSGLKSVFEKLRFRDGCVDGRPNRRSKAACSKCPSLVWALTFTTFKLIASPTDLDSVHTELERFEK